MTKSANVHQICHAAFVGAAISFLNFAEYSEERATWVLCMVSFAILSIVVSHVYFAANLATFVHIGGIVVITSFVFVLDISVRSRAFEFLISAFIILPFLDGRLCQQFGTPHLGKWLACSAVAMSCINLSMMPHPVWGIAGICVCVFAHALPFWVATLWCGTALDGGALRLAACAFGAAAVHFSKLTKHGP